MEEEVRSQTIKDLKEFLETYPLIKSFDVYFDEQVRSQGVLIFSINNYKLSTIFYSNSVIKQTLLGQAKADCMKRFLVEINLTAEELVLFLCNFKKMYENNNKLLLLSCLVDLLPESKIINSDGRELLLTVKQALRGLD